MGLGTMERERIAADETTGAALPVPAERPSPVLERLHALVRKGYRPELGAADSDVIVLRHLGRAPDLVLHPDGRVADHDGRRPRFKRNIEIGAPIASSRDADDLRFLKFLDTVPKARLWDRTRQFRKKFLYFPAALGIGWGMSMGLWAIFVG